MEWDPALDTSLGVRPWVSLIYSVAKGFSPYPDVFFSAEKNTSSCPYTAYFPS